MKDISDIMKYQEILDLLKTDTKRHTERIYEAAHRLDAGLCGEFIARWFDDVKIKKHRKTGFHDTEYRLDGKHVKNYFLYDGMYFTEGLCYSFQTFICTLNGILHEKNIERMLDGRTLESARSLGLLREESSEIRRI